jgi:hypothetical protein
MEKQLRAISKLQHEKELAVYQIGNSYRICEDNGELVATNKVNAFVEIKGPIDELGIRKLKEVLTRKNSRLKKPADVVVKKTCSCGNYFELVPDDAIKDKQGFWWNCKCRSTLFYGFNLVPKDNRNGTTKDNQQNNQQ